MGPITHCKIQTQKDFLRKEQHHIALFTCTGKKRFCKEKLLPPQPHIPTFFLSSSCKNTLIKKNTIKTINTIKPMKPMKLMKPIEPMKPTKPIESKKKKTYTVSTPLTIHQLSLIMTSITSRLVYN